MAAYMATIILFNFLFCIGVEPITENGNPLWYFCLRNPVDRGVGQAI